jgi:hypothetical protein
MTGIEALDTWRAELKWPNWDSESYPESRDLMIIPLFSVFFFTIRYLLDTFVFERLGRKLILGKAGFQNEFQDQESLRRTVVKFKESLWKLCYFLSAEIMALYITYNEPYFLESRNFWVGPGSQQWPNQKIKLKLKLLYAFEGGFYAYSILALIFWETRRKDFGVSMSHHVATLVLIVFSYLARFVRVGSVVLAVHDGSDVFLEIGKLTKYSGFEIIPSISFVCFAISWVLLRLLIFPFWVIRSTSYEVLTILDRDYKGGPMLYYIFNTLLMSLFILHIYWWILIWRMIVKQIEARGKVADDVRSDSDEEEDDKID